MRDLPTLIDVKKGAIPVHAALKGSGLVSVGSVAI